MTEKTDIVARQGHSRTSPRWTRRRFVLAAAAGSLAGYAGLVEPNEIELRTLDVRLKRLPAQFEGLRIGLLSDLHLAPFTTEAQIQSAVDVLQRAVVDVAVNVGDFVSNPEWTNSRTARVDRATKADPAARILQQLSAPLGHFAVLGNHDVSTSARVVSDALRAHGIAVLRN